MKIKIILIFFILVSCSSNSELEINVEDLKKEGEVIINSKIYSGENQEEIKKIDQVKINNSITNKFLLKSDLIKNNIKIVSKSYYKTNNNNSYKRSIVSYNNNIIFVDDYSNIVILDKNLKLIKKIKSPIERKYENFPLRSSLLVHEDTLFVADNYGNVFSTNLNSYSIAWQLNLGVPFVSNLVMYKNSLFVINLNGKIYSINAISGKQNWSFETGGSKIDSEEAYKIFQKENILVFTNSSGNVYCIDILKQSVLWNYKIPFNVNSQNYNNFFYVNDLLVEKNFLFISTSFGILKTDIQIGKPLWLMPIYSKTNFINNFDTLITVDVNGFLTIIDKSRGDILFKKNISKYELLRKINLKIENVNDIFTGYQNLYLVTNDGNLIAIKASNLDIVFLSRIAKSVNSNIVLFDKKIFFIGNKDLIYSIE